MVDNSQNGFFIMFYKNKKKYQNFEANVIISKNRKILVLCKIITYTFLYSLLGELKLFFYFYSEN